jgi:hypothetical protein
MTVPVDPVAEIRRLYFATSKATIADDLARAIDLLKRLPSDDERQRAAVFMDGLSQMRSEWQGGGGSGGGQRPGGTRRPGKRR